MLNGYPPVDLHRCGTSMNIHYSSIMLLGKQCIYIYMYIYIYMVPPPRDLPFHIFAGIYAYIYIYLFHIYVSLA